MPLSRDHALFRCNENRLVLFCRKVISAAPPPEWVVRCSAMGWRRCDSLAMAVAAVSTGKQVTKLAFGVRWFLQEMSSLSGIVCQ